MVARQMPAKETPAPPSPGRLADVWFRAWRRALTRAFRGAGSVWRAAARALGTASAGVLRSARGTAVEVGDALSAAPRGIGRTWRRAVSAIARVVAPVRRWRTARATAEDAVRFWTRPATFGDLSAGAADRVGALGFRLSLLGLGASVAVGLWRTGGWRPAAGAAITTTVWAFARLGVLVWLAPGDRRTRVVVAAVWAASLAPFGLGLTEGLRLVALAASAVLCLGALRGIGVPEKDVRSMVGWSFGGQAAVTLGGLAVRALLALVLA